MVESVSTIIQKIIESDNNENILEIEFVRYNDNWDYEVKIIIINDYIISPEGINIKIEGKEIIIPSNCDEKYEFNLDKSDYSIISIKSYNPIELNTNAEIENDINILNDVELKTVETKSDVKKLLDINQLYNENEWEMTNNTKNNEIFQGLSTFLKNSNAYIQSKAEYILDTIQLDEQNQLNYPDTKERILNNYYDNGNFVPLIYNKPRFNIIPNRNINSIDRNQKTLQIYNIGIGTGNLEKKNKTVIWGSSQISSLLSCYSKDLFAYENPNENSPCQLISCPSLVSKNNWTEGLIKKEREFNFNKKFKEQYYKISGGYHLSYLEYECLLNKGGQLQLGNKNIIDLQNGILSNFNNNLLIKGVPESNLIYKKDEISYRYILDLHNIEVKSDDSDSISSSDSGSESDSDSDKSFDNTGDDFQMIDNDNIFHEQLNYPIKNGVNSWHQCVSVNNIIGISHIELNGIQSMDIFSDSETEDKDIYKLLYWQTSENKLPNSCFRERMVTGPTYYEKDLVSLDEIKGRVCDGSMNPTMVITDKLYKVHCDSFMNQINKRSQKLKYLDGEEINVIGFAWKNNKIDRKKIYNNNNTQYIDTSYFNNCEISYDLNIPLNILDICLQSNNILLDNEWINETANSECLTTQNTAWLFKNILQGKSKITDKDYEDIIDMLLPKLENLNDIINKYSINNLDDLNYQLRLYNYDIYSQKNNLGLNKFYQSFQKNILNIDNNNKQLGRIYLNRKNDFKFISDIINNLVDKSAIDELSLEKVKYNFKKILEYLDIYQNGKLNKKVKKILSQELNEFLENEENWENTEEIIKVIKTYLIYYFGENYKNNIIIQLLEKSNSIYNYDTEEEKEESKEDDKEDPEIKFMELSLCNYYDFFDNFELPSNSINLNFTLNGITLLQNKFNCFLSRFPDKGKLFEYYSIYKSLSKSQPDSNDIGETISKPPINDCQNHLFVKYYFSYKELEKDNYRIINIDDQDNYLIEGYKILRNIVLSYFESGINIERDLNPKGDEIIEKFVNQVNNKFSQQISEKLILEMPGIFKNNYLLTDKQLSKNDNLIIPVKEGDYAILYSIYGQNKIYKRKDTGKNEYWNEDEQLSEVYQDNQDLKGKTLINDEISFCELYDIDEIRNLDGNCLFNGKCVSPKLYHFDNQVTSIKLTNALLDNQKKLISDQFKKEYDRLLQFKRLEYSKSKEHKYSDLNMLLLSYYFYCKDNDEMDYFISVVKFYYENIYSEYKSSPKPKGTTIILWTDWGINEDNKNYIEKVESEYLDLYPFKQKFKTILSLDGPSNKSKYIKKFLLTDYIDFSDKYYYYRLPNYNKNNKFFYQACCGHYHQLSKVYENGIYNKEEKKELLIIWGTGINSDNKNYCKNCGELLDIDDLQDQREFDSDTNREITSIAISDERRYSMEDELFVENKYGKLALKYLNFIKNFTTNYLNISPKINQSDLTFLLNNYEDNDFILSIKQFFDLTLQNIEGGKNITSSNLSFQSRLPFNNIFIKSSKDEYPLMLKVGDIYYFYNNKREYITKNKINKESITSIFGELNELYKRSRNDKRYFEKIKLNLGQWESFDLVNELLHIKKKKRVEEIRLEAIDLINTYLFIQSYKAYKDFHNQLNILSKLIFLILTSIEPGYNLLSTGSEKDSKIILPGNLNFNSVGLDIKYLCSSGSIEDIFTQNQDLFITAISKIFSKNNTWKFINLDNNDETRVSEKKVILNYLRKVTCNNIDNISRKIDNDILIENIYKEEIGWNDFKPDLDINNLNSGVMSDLQKNIDSSNIVKINYKYNKIQNSNLYSITENYYHNIDTEGISINNLSYNHDLVFPPGVNTIDSDDGRISNEFLIPKNNDDIKKNITFLSLIFNLEDNNNQSKRIYQSIEVNRDKIREIINNRPTIFSMIDSPISTEIIEQTILSGNRTNKCYIDLTTFKFKVELEEEIKIYLETNTNYKDEYIQILEKIGKKNKFFPNECLLELPKNPRLLEIIKDDKIKKIPIINSIIRKIEEGEELNNEENYSVLNIINNNPILSKPICYKAINENIYKSRSFINYFKDQVINLKSLLENMFNLIEHQISPNLSLYDNLENILSPYIVYLLDTSDESDKDNINNIQDEMNNTDSNIDSIILGINQNLSKVIGKQIPSINSENITLIRNTLNNLYTFLDHHLVNILDDPNLINEEKINAHLDENYPEDYSKLLSKITIAIKNNDITEVNKSIKEMIWDKFEIDSIQGTFMSNVNELVIFQNIMDECCEEKTISSIYNKSYKLRDRLLEFKYKILLNFPLDSKLPNNEHIINQFFSVLENQIIKDGNTNIEDINHICENILSNNPGYEDNINWLSENIKKFLVENIYPERIRYAINNLKKINDSFLQYNKFYCIHLDNDFFDNLELSFTTLYRCNITETDIHILPDVYNCEQILSIIYFITEFLLFQNCNIIANGDISLFKSYFKNMITNYEKGDAISNLTDSEIELFKKKQKFEQDLINIKIAKESSDEVRNLHQLFRGFGLGNQSQMANQMKDLRENPEDMTRSENIYEGEVNNNSSNDDFNGVDESPMFGEGDGDDGNGNDD